MSKYIFSHDDNRNLYIDVYSKFFNEFLCLLIIKGNSRVFGKVCPHRTLTKCTYLEVLKLFPCHKEYIEYINSIHNELNVIKVNNDQFIESDKYQCNPHNMCCHAQSDYRRYGRRYPDDTSWSLTVKGTNIQKIQKFLKDGN